MKAQFIILIISNLYGDNIYIYVCVCGPRLHLSMRNKLHAWSNTFIYNYRQPYIYGPRLSFYTSIGEEYPNYGPTLTLSLQLVYSKGEGVQISTCGHVKMMSITGVTNKNYFGNFSI